MPYDSNLALPICPKCKDSIEVKKRETYPIKMSVGTYAAYTCDSCEIFWDTTGFTSEIGEGHGFNQ